jgi:argininosuccinate lyase
LDEKKQSKLWAGRFSDPTDPIMERFSRSIGFDIRLLPMDIRVNKAWAEVLCEAGIISNTEQETIHRELDNLEKDFVAGDIKINTDDEDVHMFVERCLTERLGQVGKRIHYGRSRNDQVATDVRLFLRESLSALDAALAELQSVIIKRTEQELETIMPGYTHLQQAQPILLSHYLLSFFWALQRDRQRQHEAAKRANIMPLGAAALAGTTLSIDLERLAQKLGFERPADNSIDAVSERDSVLDVLQLCSQIMVHLSRYAEDWIIWSSQEFGFLILSDKYTTGSSIMPQKRNPDALELIRGKTARIVANEVKVLTLLKGLPLTYNRDLQEDKEPLFDSLDQTEESLRILIGVLETVQFNRKRMRDAVHGNTLATDLADYLVHQGIPFREAHQLVGKVVAQAESKGLLLTDLSTDDLQAIDQRFGTDSLQLLDPMHSISSRKSIGGTSIKSVRNQLRKAKSIFDRN